MRHAKRTVFSADNLPDDSVFGKLELVWVHSKHRDESCGNQHGRFAHHFLERCGFRRGGGRAIGKHQRHAYEPGISGGEGFPSERDGTIVFRERTERDACDDRGEWQPDAGGSIQSGGDRRSGRPTDHHEQLYDREFSLSKFERHRCARAERT